MTNEDKAAIIFMYTTAQLVNELETSAEFKIRFERIIEAIMSEYDRLVLSSAKVKVH